MPATGPKGITNAQLRAALRKHAGVFSLAARELGCDRSNVDQRVKGSTALQAFCRQIDEEIGDACEAVIFNAIVSGDRAMARWYAPIKMRNRGYVTRTETTGPDGVALPAGPQVHFHVSYVDAAPPVALLEAEEVI